MLLVYIREKKCKFIYVLSSKLLIYRNITFHRKIKYTHRHSHPHIFTKDNHNVAKSMQSGFYLHSFNKHSINVRRRWMKHRFLPHFTNFSPLHLHFIIVWTSFSILKDYFFFIFRYTFGIGVSAMRLHKIKRLPKGKRTHLRAHTSKDTHRETYTFHSHLSGVHGFLVGLRKNS